MEDAQKVLSAALQSGFRESGAVGLGHSAEGSITPVVAVRSSGLGLDSIIGYQDSNGSNISLVSESYLRNIACIINEKFRVNDERILRFEKALESYDQKKNASSDEDAETRRRRKREEGLRRQHELQSFKEVKRETSDPMRTHEDDSSFLNVDETYSDLLQL